MRRSATIIVGTVMVFVDAPSARAAVGVTTAVQSIGWANPVDSAIAEASLRFGVPVSWIRAVIRAESFGDPRAVSTRGAVGLMQVTPPTYADLQGHLRLGSDPFDIHDNVSAGTAYLRLMFDRFGLAGMVGAYNAGPTRWQAYLAGVQPLPNETIGYLRRLGPEIGFDPPAMRPSASTAAPRSPLEAPIFVGLTSGLIGDGLNAERRHVIEAITKNPTLIDPSDGLFGSTASTADLPGDRSPTGPPPSSPPTPGAAGISSESASGPLFAPILRGHLRQ